MTSLLVPPGADLCALPAGIPPDGQLSDFANPASLTTATVVVGILLTILALAFVAARVMVNRRKLSWSDYFMVIGMTFDIAFTAVFLSISKYNRHVWDIPACWMTPTFMKLQFTITLLVGPASYFSKSSIFLLYRQLFSVKRSMGIAIYIGLVATFLAYFPTIPLSVYYATPHDGLSWADLFTSDELGKLVYLGITLGSLAVALDICIFILPLPTLAALHMSLKTRVKLISVFSTALMGVVASVVALVYRVKLLHGSDPTWQQAAFYLAMIVENNVAIIVGSMPAVATFVRVYVSESPVIKALRLRFQRTDGDSSGKDSKPSFRRSDLATFASPNAQRPGRYELTDPTITAAQIAPDEHDLMFANNTAKDKQAYAQRISTDRLV